jgi:hypothetical protein
MWPTMPLSLLKTPRKLPQKPKGGAGDHRGHDMKDRLGTSIIHNEQRGHAISDRDAEQIPATMEGWAALLTVRSSNSYIA